MDPVDRPDVILEDHGSIWLIQPLNLAAETWLREFTPQAMRFHGATVVEPRYVPDLAQGMLA